LRKSKSCWESQAAEKPKGNWRGEERIWGGHYGLDENPARDFGGVRGGSLDEYVVIGWMISCVGNWIPDSG